MKLNQKQKKIIYVWLLIISAAILLWVGFGVEIFTKTQIIVEKRDELLGTTYKEWKEQFVLGLDYTIGFIGIVSMITAFIVWWLKTK